MFQTRRIALVLVGLLMVVLATACAAPGALPPPAAPPAAQATAAPQPATQAATQTVATEAPTTAATQAASAAPGKTLTIAMSQEPRGFGVMVAQIAAIEVEQSLNAYWTYRDADLKPQPWLVEKIPTIEDGDWVVNPDGTMVVTWKLRPNITWSDGAPLTVEDVIFGWQVMTDPDIPAFGKGSAQQIDKIEKVDDRTFKVYWKNKFVFANQGLPELSTTARPLPRHILEEEFKTDKEKFKNDPYWTKAFVGTGPYKIVEWVPGSQITMEARPDYFLGKPKIDRLVWKFFPDTNTLMANVLSGQVDVTVTPSLSIDQALNVKQQWDKSGDGTVVTIPGFGWDWLALNGFKNPAFNDVRVRQALLYAIDRKTLVDSLFQGLNPVMDSWLPPRHPLLTDAVKAQEHHYDFDLQKAADLFAEAGWKKGADGILTNDKGEKFAVSIRTLAGDKTKEASEAIVADSWKQAGIQVDIDNQPSSIIYDDQHLFHFGWPSVFLFNYGGNPNLLADEYKCADIPSEANSWSGGNISGFCSPDYDKEFAVKVIDQQLDVKDREEIAGRLAKVWSRDLFFLPLYAKSEVAIVRKGVTGFAPPGTNEGWLGEVYKWDINR